MASKIITNLLPLPFTHTYPNRCPMVVSGRPSSLNSASRIPNSRVLSVGSSFGPLTAAPARRRSFVVRAEEEAAENAEAVAAEEVSETAEEGGVSESEAVADEEKPPRKPRVKLGDVMGILNKRAIEASLSARPLPANIRVGDILEIKWEVPQKRRRFTKYRGIVISRQNAGIHTTIRVRRIIAGIGVEIVFPLYSPRVLEINVIQHRNVRRARLYYLRDKLPRFCTFK